MVPAALYALDLFTGKITNKGRQANVKHLASLRVPALVQGLLSVTTAGLKNGKIVQLVEHYKVFHYFLMCLSFSSTNERI